MTDAEFANEIRRGLMTIMRAMIRKFCLSWDWFLPRTEPYIIGANSTPTLPFDTPAKTGV